MRRFDFFFALARIISDGLAISMGLFLSYFLRMKWFLVLGISAPTTLYSLEAFGGFSIKSALFLIFVFAINGRYAIDHDEKKWDEFYQLFWSFTAGFALLVVLFFFSKFIFFSRFIFGTAWVLGLIFLITGRYWVRKLRRKFYDYGWGRERILLLGSGKLLENCLQYIVENPKYELVGLLSDKAGRHAPKGFHYAGTFDDLSEQLEHFTPEQVLLATPEAHTQLTHDLIRTSHRYHAKFRYIPDELGLDLASVDTSTMGPFPIINLRNHKIEGWGYVIKSAVDYLLALILLILISPLLGWIAWKLKKENPETSIFYRSDRVGRRGKHFQCLKFRTMVPDAEKLKQKLLKKNDRKGGVLFKMKKDPRITKFGSFLRQWSFDELPNLWNVLRGEMSLIGPRPHLPEEVKKYRPEDLQILTIKPGLTGFAQINGRSELEFEEEMRYELFYMKNWSLWLDVIIFFKTLIVVWKKENVS